MTKEKKVALQAIAGHGVLVIVVSADVVKFATEHHDDFWDPDTDTWRFKVTDEQEWVESVARRLNRELGEDGSTLLTKALDAAILDAVEQGQEGVEDVRP